MAVAKWFHGGTLEASKVWVPFTCSRQKCTIWIGMNMLVLTTAEMKCSPDIAIHDEWSAARVARRYLDRCHFSL